MGNPNSQILVLNATSYQRAAGLLEKNSLFQVCRKKSIVKRLRHLVTLKIELLKKKLMRKLEKVHTDQRQGNLSINKDNICSGMRHMKYDFIITIFKGPISHLFFSLGTF